MLDGGQQTFNYDPDGNFTTYWSTSGFSYDAQDRLLTHPWGQYGYDANGAVYTQPGMYSTADPTYWYDALSNLRQVYFNWVPLTLTYSVDPKNRRLAKFKNGSFTDGWIYDGDRIVGQINASGQVVAQFVYSTKSNVPDLMFAWTGSIWETWRILSDQVGSVRALVHMADGAVTYFDYRDPWGPPNQPVQYTSGGTTRPLPFAFAGGLYDSDSGLYRFGARDYDPWLGRWWSKDPIRFGGGDNLYVYCGNDPVNCIDPTGTSPDLFFCLSHTRFLDFKALLSCLGGYPFFGNGGVLISGAPQGPKAAFRGECGPPFPDFGECGGCLSTTLLSAVSAFAATRIQTVILKGSPLQPIQSGRRVATMRASMKLAFKLVRHHPFFFPVPMSPLPLIEALP